MVLNLSKTHKNGTSPANMATPMPAGPIVYREDGAIDWSNMWDSFCVLAQEGGPPASRRLASGTIKSRYY